MREIKFKFWDGKEMHDGSRIVFKNDPQVTSDISVFSVNGFFEDSFRRGWVAIQYTGMIDPVGGREIYDGDVYQTFDSNYVVEYKEDNSCSPHETIGYDDIRDSIRRGWKYLGNIYENPELIK